MESYAVKFPERLKMTEDEFFAFCQENRHLRMEKTSQGNIIIMSPTGGETGRTNFKISTILGNWNEQTMLGEAFDSSTGFSLPNGATRSPDAAWVLQSRWDALSSEEKKKFPPLCPDFIIELRSGSDHLPELRSKMQEWMENGCRLAWLLDPVEKKVVIYRHGQAPEERQGFDQQLSGEEVLPGFVLDLSRL
ncbi:MAG: Uma2 family endonuclease [Cyclobacteriaceae bacterium]